MTFKPFTKPIGQLRQFRPSKAWIVLGAALLIGGLAAMAAYNYLKNQIEAIESRSKGKTVVVVVAKTDLAKGTALSNQTVAVREVPAEYAHSGALTPDDFGRADGQLLAFPVKAGEMVLWGLLEAQRAPTFSARVEAGRRAMTVPVDEISSISGMLEPGDTIDLMVTLDQDGKKITFPLLQSVQVMATGQRVAHDEASGEQRQFGTVTLNTTPEQARNVIVARDAGKLTALLRNPQDKQPLQMASYDMNALLGGRPKGKGAGGGGVPVLYGGSIGNAPADSLRLFRGRTAGAEPDGDEAPAPRAPRPTVAAQP
jgi:pilus assembly protein CpaB